MAKSSARAVAAALAANKAALANSTALSSDANTAPVVPSNTGYSLLDTLKAAFQADTLSTKYARVANQTFAYLMMREHAEMVRRDDKPAAWSDLAKPDNRLARTEFCKAILERAHGPMPEQVRGDHSVAIAEAQKERRTRLARMVRFAQTAAEYVAVGLSYGDWDADKSCFLVPVSALLSHGYKPTPGGRLAKHDAAKRQVLLDDSDYYECKADDESNSRPITANLARINKVIADRKTLLAAEHADMERKARVAAGQPVDQLPAKGATAATVPAVSGQPGGNNVPAAPVANPTAPSVAAGAQSVETGSQTDQRDTKLPIGRGDFDTLVIEIALIIQAGMDADAPVVPFSQHPEPVQTALSLIYGYVAGAMRLDAERDAVNAATPRDEPVIKAA